MTTLYAKEGIQQLGQLAKLAQQPNKAFGAWNQAVFQEGALSTKLKEIIAVASATTTGCAYCIDIHTGAAKKAGATKEELAEAILVASALKAGSAFAHAANAFRSYDGEEGDTLYKKEYFSKTNEFGKPATDALKTFVAFSNEAVAEGVLSVKEKELIAVAIAHITACAYCIDIHTNGAKKAGVTKEELAEAIFVASALNAGSAYAHSINALNTYDAK